MASVPAKIVFYRPGRSFPSLSVTGRECALSCDYCQGHYLQGMEPIASGEDLLAFALRHQVRGGKGFLLSGGCDAEGKVPFGPVLEAVREVKRRTGLQVNIHTGLLDYREEAEHLVASRGDCFSVDIVQDIRIIREVMHLDRGPEDYRRTLRLLFSSGAGRVVPHLCIGLAGDSTTGEERALRLISEFPVSSMVLLAFLPAKGTPIAGLGPPSSDHVRHIVEMAVRTIGAPVLLGCMRPRGDWRLETDLILSGLAGMAVPSPRTVRWARENGLGVEWREECCALHR